MFSLAGFASSAAVELIAVDLEAELSDQMLWVPFADVITDPATAILVATTYGEYYPNSGGKGAVQRSLG